MMYSKRHLPDIEQWLQRHPEAGSSWPSWPKASQFWRQHSNDTFTPGLSPAQTDHFHRFHGLEPERQCHIGFTDLSLKQHETIYIWTHVHYSLDSGSAQRLHTSHAAVPAPPVKSTHSERARGQPPCATVGIWALRAPTEARLCGVQSRFT